MAKNRSTGRGPWSHWIVLSLSLSACAASGAAPDTAGEGAPAVPEAAEAPAPAAPEAPAPAVSLEPCDLPGFAGTARCGAYTLFEDRRSRQGRRIDLAVAVLPATGVEPAAEPILFLPGGPGQGSVAAAGLVSGLLAEPHRRHDLVFIDPRGTGGSNPLDCRLPGSDEAPEAFFGEMFPVEVLRRCAGELDADLAHYTTPVAVDDLDEVRAALGYDRVHLFGFSYGSRLALVYLRRHPERVASAILFGAVPTDMKTPLHHAPDAQRALDLVFAACTEEEACRAAYPGLEEKFWEVHRRLSAAPAPVEFADPKTGRPVAVDLTVDHFNEEIRWRLYDEEANLVPILVQEAHEGDYTKTASLLLRLRRVTHTGAALAVGTFLSVTCSEDVPRIDAEEARRLAAGTFLGTYRVDQQVRACSVWPRGELPEGYHEPVRSEAPVLVLSGFRDPVTPPHWGEEVVEHLPNGRHVVLRQGYHAEFKPCVRQIMAAFLAAGSAAELDVSCAAESPPAPFVLPGSPVDVH